MHIHVFLVHIFMNTYKRLKIYSGFNNIPLLRKAYAKKKKKIIFFKVPYILARKINSNEIVKMT